MGAQSNAESRSVSGDRAAYMREYRARQPPELRARRLAAARAYEKASSRLRAANRREFERLYVAARAEEGLEAPGGMRPGRPRRGGAGT